MKRFTLRIDDTLNDWLEQQASLSHRSKNQHIAYLLQAMKTTSEANKRRLSNISIADLFESTSMSVLTRGDDD